MPPTIPYPDPPPPLPDPPRQWLSSAAFWARRAALMRAKLHKEQMRHRDRRPSATYAIWGRDGIAAAMGVSPRTLDKYVAQYGFPVLGLGHVWVTTRGLIDHWVLQKIQERRRQR